MNVGKCRHCGHEPVAFDAFACPKCGGRSPNPNVTHRYAGRGAAIGMLLGGLGGAVWGYLGLAGGGGISAVIGFMVGAVAGLILGWLGGIVAGLGAFLGGKK